MNHWEQIIPNGLTQIQIGTFKAINNSYNNFDNTFINAINNGAQFTGTITSGQLTLKCASVPSVTATGTVSGSNNISYVCNGAITSVPVSMENKNTVTIQGTPPSSPVSIQIPCWLEDIKIGNINSTISKNFVYYMNQPSGIMGTMTNGVLKLQAVENLASATGSFSMTSPNFISYKCKGSSSYVNQQVSMAEGATISIDLFKRPPNPDPQTIIIPKNVTEIDLGQKVYSDAIDSTFFEDLKNALFTNKETFKGTVGQYDRSLVLISNNPNSEIKQQFTANFFDFPYCISYKTTGSNNATSFYVYYSQTITLKGAV